MQLHFSGYQPFSKLSMQQYGLLCWYDKATQLFAFGFT